MEKKERNEKRDLWRNSKWTIKSVICAINDDNSTRYSHWINLLYFFHSLPIENYSIPKAKKRFSLFDQREEVVEYEKKKLVIVHIK